MLLIISIVQKYVKKAAIDTHSCTQQIAQHEKKTEKPPINVRACKVRSRYSKERMHFRN
jgi:hypothetical protein